MDLSSRDISAASIALVRLKEVPLSFQPPAPKHHMVIFWKKHCSTNGAQRLLGSTEAAPVVYNLSVIHGAFNETKQ